MQAKITSDTYLKQSTVPVKELPADKKVFVNKGLVLEIERSELAANGHRKITLLDKLGGYQTWCVFDDHCLVDGEQQDILLKAPYYSQRDNNSPEWFRQCNTSACSCLAEFLKPGCIKGSDDFFFRNYVQSEGDTTDHSAVGRALKRIGIDSVFRYDLDYSDLNRSLELGLPIVIGVLHRGSIARPEGSGHMITVIGRYSGGYICNDSWGAGFDYSDHNGKCVKYPISSLDRRWLVDGDGTGWGRLVTAIDGKKTGL